eukprot:146952-Ditylum_brightwellii.AAC.1
MAKYKAEACQWIDNVEESLCDLFSPEEINKITTGSQITRSYKLVASEYAKDDAMAYKNFLTSQNIMLNSEDTYAESQEDHLENCWKEPPRSVYSCTTYYTAPTGTSSSVSSLTDPKGQTSDVLNQTLQDIVICTETVENAYQEDKAVLKQLQETMTAPQHNTTVQDNIALLCKQSESITQKTNKLEAWKVQFNAAKEKHFKELEKKMKKQFECQEENTDRKFKDMNTTTGKNK